MLTNSAFLLIAFAGLKLANAASAVPDTPAGHTLAAWVAAINSGQTSPINHFVWTFHSPRNFEVDALEQHLAGKLEVLKIETSKPLHIVFRIKEQKTASEALGILDLSTPRPPTIRAFRLYAAPIGVPYKPYVLDAAQRKRVVEASRRALVKSYVYPELGEKMSTALESHLDRGDFNSMTDGADFSEKLTAQLHAISHDKHLNVEFYLFARPQHKASKAANGNDSYRKQMAQTNCGFERVEHLPGNIGYLKFDAFESPDICGPTVAAAMNFLTNSDALIIDLRDNGGGGPAMVALIESYLFDKKTHLNDIYVRDEDRTIQFWTLPYVPGKRFGTQPVYVLTSHNTFSGAEEFAYSLKSLKRATVVGERTAGGAHPYHPYRIDAHFEIDVPHARPINPVTHTDWEGTGVEPDVTVAAGDALKKAIGLATQKLEQIRHDRGHEAGGTSSSSD